MSEEEATALEVYQQPENPDALPPNVTERRRENKKAFASQDEEMPEEKMDYMTLAKAGGRRDLLRHYEYEGPSGGPLSYPWVDWFDHMHVADTEAAPRQELQQAGSVYTPSNLLHWSVKDKSPQHKRLRLPAISLHHKRAVYPRAVPPRQQRSKTRLPSLPEEPLNFSKLLAMDYQKEWIESSEEKAHKERIKLQEKRRQKHKKLLEHTMRARQIAGVDQPHEEKPRFIMKKFASVPPRLKLPHISKNQEKLNNSDQ